LDYCGFMKWGERLTQEQHDRFLERICEDLNVTAACENIGVHKMVMYQLRREDPEFAAEWDEAIETSWSDLEKVIRQLALDGDAGEPVYGQPDDKGERKIVFYKRKSLAAIKMAARAYLPRFRDQLGIDINGTGSVSVAISLTAPKPAPEPDPALPAPEPKVKIKGSAPAIASPSAPIVLQPDNRTSVDLTSDGLTSDDHSTSEYDDHSISEYSPQPDPIPERIEVPDEWA